MPITALLAPIGIVLLLLFYFYGCVKFGALLRRNRKMRERLDGERNTDW
jgi:hypothetical protein